MSRKRKNNNYPPLYDVFDLGDRVKRFYLDKNGNYKEYKGIILAIDSEGVEIYWDTLNGKYRPNNMNIAFSNCPINEIIKGSENYSPIKKERS